MPSAYDDEIWEQVPGDPGPPDEHLARFVRGLGRAKRALDVGCGDGRLTAELQAGELTAADVSAVALERARRRLPEAQVVQLEPDAPLPFDDNAFELVLCAETIEHVRDVQLLLSEARRVLEPGGRLAVTTPAHGRLTGLDVLLRGFERRFDPLSPHLRFFTRRSLARLLDATGFEVRELRSERGSLLAVAARGPSGTATYIERLLPELGGVEVVEARQPFRMRPGAGNPLRSALNLAADLVWIHAGLPLAARRAKADLIHHPLPAHSLFTRRPQVVTVHDVAFERMPERFDRAWRAVARRRHRGAVRRAAAVICVSEVTAADAVRLLCAPRERIVVAHLGPGQNLPPREPVEPPRHFLYVGDDEPRKNLGLLRERRHELPLPLVLAGKAGGTSPSTEELAGLLAAAAALAHPALHEGFGLTLLEAMAAGTPVVAVRNDGVEEVCGDAALLVEPAELAAAMAHVAADRDLRERLRTKGRERAARFSWSGCARRHEAAYTLACS